MSEKIIKKEYKNEKFVIEGKINNITNGNNTYLIGIEILNVLENKEVILNTHFLTTSYKDDSGNIKNYKKGDNVFITGRMDKTIYENSYTEISVYFDKIERGKPTEEKQEEKPIEKQEDISLYDLLKQNKEKKKNKIIDFHAEIEAVNNKKSKKTTNSIKKEGSLIIDYNVDDADTLDDEELVKKHENDEFIKREFKKVYN